MTKIGIIGGKGRMGAAFAQFFREHGDEVLISDRRTALSNRKLAKTANVIIVSVPIDKTEKVIESIAPNVRKSALLMDLTSVKERPVKAMLQSKAAVIGAHPMCNETTFGPGQTMLYCPARPGKWIKWFRDTFGKEGGLNLVKLTPRKHDEMMSLVQGLIHFTEFALGKTLHDLDPSLEQMMKLASPASQMQLKIAARHLAQDPNLYGNIQIQNPRNPKILKKYQEAVNALVDIVQSGDLKKFTEQFKEGDRFFGKFGKEAFHETDALISRMATPPVSQPEKPPKNAVGSLGSTLTFSYLATEKWRKKRKNPIVFYDTVTEIAEAVAEGRIKEGVIPIENRLHGTVRETMDALFHEKIHIIGEVRMPIHHCLAVNRGVNKEDVQTVMSHPQALYQCSHALKKRFPNAKWAIADSTAAAFETVSKQHDQRTAVIGPEAAAKHFGMKILAKKIENDHKNETRFVAISRTPLKAAPNRNAKTSIVFYFSKDRPGSLFEVFQIFANLKLNLTRIESRPAPKALGEYLFYLDFDGSAVSKKGRQAITSIHKITDGLKILGVY